MNNRHQQDNNGSSGTYLTGSCESNKNPPELEGGALVDMPPMQQQIKASTGLGSVSNNAGGRYAGGMASNFNNAAGMSKGNAYGVGMNNNASNLRHQ